MEAVWSDGAVWARSALADDVLERLDALAGDERRAGQRVTISDDWLDLLGPAGPVGEVARQVHRAARPVRLITFNKTSGGNWAIPWHQDRVIAVAERHDVECVGNWSRKGEVWHCEPPQDVLERMFFLRIFLDDCDEGSGGMSFAVGSHRLNVVASGGLVDVIGPCPIATERASRGDVLALAMLTAHASSPSRSQANRRILRVDYATDSPPAPLRFAVDGDQPNRP